MTTHAVPLMRRRKNYLAGCWSMQTWYPARGLNDRGYARIVLRHATEKDVVDGATPVYWGEELYAELRERIERAL